MTEKIGNATKYKCNTMSSAVHLQQNCTYVHGYSKECMEIMGVMVVTWLMHAGLPVSA